MAESLLARVYPKTLKAVETYHTETTVSLIPEKENKSESEGKIEIITPYEGGAYFRPYAISDIERQRKQKKWQRGDKIKIGHLYIEDVKGNVEFASPLPRHPAINAEDVIPVNISLLGTRRELTADKKSSNWTVAYTPKIPKNPLVQIDAEVWDEDALTENMAHRKGNDRRRDDIAIAKQMRVKMDIRQTLKVRLYVTIDVPRSQSHDKPLVIEEMQLDWPIATAYKLVDLAVGDEKKVVFYDPTEQGVIRWHDVEMAYQGEPDGMGGVWRFSAEPITLTISTPGEIYMHEKLTGKFSVKVPYLLSGLRLAFFNAIGYMEEVDQHSLVKSAFTVDIKRFFEMRTYSPRQQLHFQNVLVEEARVDDVKSLLADLGLDFKQPIELNTPNQYLLHATKRHLASKLEVWILMMGTHHTTFREDSIQGDVVYTSPLTAGHTTFVICCEASFDSRYLTWLISKIHMKLKERFRHVSTVG